jgi:UDP-N-acetylglucosamine--N-acetylmuramyl-(pentapeptide) pyrophosphoryl-undecaprenol N-acetylglucosamine transferase
MHIVVSGGGTGGHIYPAIAVAECALREIPGATISFVGSAAGPEAKAAPAAGLTFHGLEVAGVVGKSPVKAARALLLFVKASRKCRTVLKESGASCVVATGGYASAPACYAARRLGLPLILHEMNYEPGVVTRLFSGKASMVALAYQGTASLLSRKAKTRVTGVPVRPEIEALADTDNRAVARTAAVKEFELEPSRKTLFVFGGSQGAQALNEALWKQLPALAERRDLQLLHMTGRNNFDSTGHENARLAVAGGGLIYKSCPYIERMDLAYAVADLAVCRSGAGTIAELMAAHLPAVLVPFPHATGGHQEKNARALERGGAVIVEPQVDGVADGAIGAAVRALDDAAGLQSMREAGAASGGSGGAKGIVEVIEEVMKV